MSDSKQGPGMVTHTSNPATWEAEIGRITVQGQPRQKTRETSS
jgi:hypothetical protein